jgi:hypothetical protein
MISYGKVDVVFMTAKQERKCPMADVPSLDVRVTGPVAKPKSQKSTNHTIAPAYNKGAYQVISNQNIKDIGR